MRPIVEASRSRDHSEKAIDGVELHSNRKGQKIDADTLLATDKRWTVMSCLPPVMSMKEGSSEKDAMSEVKIRNNSVADTKVKGCNPCKTML